MEVEQSQAREGDDQYGPLVEVSGLEERLYPFRSEPAETTLSPELTPNLDESKRDELCSLISQFPSVFSDKPGCTTVTQHEVCGGCCTNPSEAVPDPHSQRAAMKQELDQMLAENTIQPSTSLWASPIVLVPRKDGEVQFCVDFHRVNRVAKFVAYPYAYTLPHFTYADSVWNTCTAAQSVKLECIQNYAARLILQQRREVSATWMRKQLGWPTLASRRRLSEAIVTFRCTSGLSPLNLSTLFKPAVSVHHHGTRYASSNSLYPPRVSTEFGKKSFAFCGAQLWNLLPPNLRQTKNLDVLMFMTRSHFLSYTS